MKKKFTSHLKGSTKRTKTLFIFVNALLVFCIVLGVYWSREPDLTNPETEALQISKRHGIKETKTIGNTTTATAIFIADTLLNKPGGFLRNDISPPGIFLDNMPSWELGVIIQLRDFIRALRKDFSRSQSQSRENSDLTIAEPQFNFNTDSWILPATESEYKKGIDHLISYLKHLSDNNDQAQFYTRADNLVQWLRDVETRLGSLSQRLSASVGKRQINIDLAGDSNAQQSTKMADEIEVKTPWLEIDNVFYEARGAAWALILLLSAIEKDFIATLKDKNALVSLKQIIRELRGTQTTLYSPMVLNGGGFGMLANHSLVMASYISRANAALSDLRSLLEQG